MSVVKEDAIKKIIRPLKVSYKDFKDDPKKKRSTYKADPRVVVNITEVFGGRVAPVKLRKGFSLNKLGFIKTSTLYKEVFYSLLRLIVRDLTEGSIVYFKKSKKSVMYIDMLKSRMEQAHLFKRYRARCGFPEIDFNKTNKRYPVVMFSSGYSGASSCRVSIPHDLKINLINTFIAGKRYSKPAGVKSHRVSIQQFQEFKAEKDVKKRKVFVRL